MNDADLIRWAAEQCGWSSAAVAHYEYTEDWRALAYDLLARFIGATPEPTWVGAGRPTEEWYAWDELRAMVWLAITESPIACIRAIHESGVLTDDA